MSSVEAWEHIVEITLLLVIILVLCGCCKKEGFVLGDPYGVSLAYDTFNSSTTSGPGTNAYLERGSFPARSYTDMTGIRL